MKVTHDISTILTKMDLSYLAGFFDGEGSVGLYWNKSIGTWQPQICITQNATPSVTKMMTCWAGYFGGSVRTYTRDRAIVDLRITSMAAILHFIRLVVPFTRIKTTQLLILKNYLETKTFGYRTSQLLKAQKRSL